MRGYFVPEVRLGAYDVGTVLAMYEPDDRPVNEPMHGSKGEVRRNPSTDQKKVRRKMTVQKQAADEAAEIETIPHLLARAAKASTLDEQQSLMAEVEKRTTAKLNADALGRSLDLTVKEGVEIIPRGTHELHTNQTDWLLSEGLRTQASATEAEHELVAQASLWFSRVPDFVKEDQEEFRIQAVNYGTHIASQYGDHAEAARQAFVSESERLYKQGAKVGAFEVKTAASLQQGMLPHPDPSSSVHGVTPDPNYQPPRTAPHQDPEHQKGPLSNVDMGVDPSVAPGLRSEVDHVLNANDASGVRQMAEGYASHTLQGSLASLQATAAVVAQEDAQLSAALAGVDAGVGQMMDTVENAADSTSNGVRDSAEQFAQSQLQDGQMHQAASGLPQVGLPADTYPSGVGEYPQAEVDSNRSPALQEIADYQGFGGQSVVPPGNSGASTANNDYEPNKDFASTQGFPVSGSQTHAAKVAAQLTKESSMNEATCPTCGGHGKVASAQGQTLQAEAYSRLPQIDQIVNADETPGATPLPEDVAWPWQMGPESVAGAINETEQQLAERQKRVGAQVQANGRDNSGWLGDNGAKGLDYPGYSTPAYDGSNNLGEPDPVYGFGGDNGNQPLQPYGEEEANDITNNPGMGYQTGQPMQADQAYRQTGPAMNTQGSYQGLHPDPVIARAQQAILQRQSELAQGRG